MPLPSSPIVSGDEKIAALRAGYFFTDTGMYKKFCSH